MRYVHCSCAAIAAAVLVVGLAACSSPASSSASSPLAGTCLTSASAPFAMAVGMRSNVPHTSYPIAANWLLQNAANDQQQISLIRIDGQPKIFTLPLFKTSANNPATRSQDLNDYLKAQVTPVLQNEIRAQAPQADVLGALSLAASATGPNGNIILIDSGLQTVAPLAYQQSSSLMMSPPSDIVEFLKQQRLLPDLTGRHVLLVGFGYTASPQPPLNQAQRNSIIAQWEAIVTAGGGCVTADTLPNTTSEVSGLPVVSAVPLPPTPNIHSTCGTIVLSDAGTVGFIVGTATFRDRSAADATLSQLAATLRRGTEHITLIGSTSTEGGDAINNPLSLHRAQTVEQVLLSMGIAASRITGIGDGSHWPGRVPDIGPNGELLPGPAEQDREVIVRLPKCQ